MNTFLSVLLAAPLVAACTEQPTREVSAVVVSVAPYANPKWDTDKVIVTARSLDGAFGSKSVFIARLNCKVGDTVQASARGVALSIDANACQR